MSRVIRGLLCVSAAVLISLLIADVSWAGLGVSPYHIEVDLPFGATVGRTVVVRNLEDEPRLIETSVHGVRSTSTGNLIWLDSEGRDSDGEIYEYGAIGSLVDIEPRDTIVPAKSSAVFTVRIDAPNAYASGAFAGRAGLLLFKSVSVGEENQAVTLFHDAFQIVTLLLIRFETHQQPQAELKRTEVLQQAPAILRFSATLENTGNVHLQPSGWVMVRDADTGQLIVNLDMSSGTTLPQCEREYHTDWDYPEDLSGTYEATYVVTYRGRQEIELVKTCVFELLEGGLEGWEIKEG